MLDSDLALMWLFYWKLKTGAVPEYHSVSEWVTRRESSSFRMKLSKWRCLHNFAKNCSPDAVCHWKWSWQLALFSVAVWYRASGLYCQRNSAVLEWAIKRFKHGKTYPYFLCKFISHFLAYTALVSLENEAWTSATFSA